MNLFPRHSLFDFDHFWSPGRSATESPNAAFLPRVDIEDKKKHVQISAELPGVEKEDIEVSLNNGILTLSAESRQESQEEKDGDVIRQERRYGRFMRSFDLGGDVQEEDIQANFKNGVLTLKVPKREERQPTSRRIEIR